MNNIKNSVRTVAITCAIGVLLLPSAFAGGMVRVDDGRRSYEGKVIALTRARCSMIDRHGRLVHLPVASLKRFEKTAARFQAHTVSQFRQALRNEFPGYEVAGTTRYLVCGPRGVADRYAKLFDSVYRDVEQFFRVRGFSVKAPDVPLVAVVFGSQEEFYRYCVNDKVPPSPTLRGYYSLVTNRVALFDSGQQVSTLDAADFHRNFGRDTVAAFAGISTDTANTIIHETTHQVGYNIGVHSRMGGTPTWVIEGLATSLEPDAMRNSRARNASSGRINAERADWFDRNHLPDRSMGNLGKLVASDVHFNRDLLDSYSEAWAFTFFLLENPARRKQFINYVQKIEKRDVTRNYSAQQRLIDFEDTFGDISRIEVEFLRYMDRM